MGRFFTSPRHGSLSSPQLTKKLLRDHFFKCFAHEVANFEGENFMIWENFTDEIFMGCLFYCINGPRANNVERSWKLSLLKVFPVVRCVHTLLMVSSIIVPKPHFLQLLQERKCYSCVVSGSVLLRAKCIQLSRLAEFLIYTMHWHLLSIVVSV